MSVFARNRTVLRAAGLGLAGAGLWLVMLMRGGGAGTAAAQEAPSAPGLGIAQRADIEVAASLSRAIRAAGSAVSPSVVQIFTAARLAEEDERVAEGEQPRRIPFRRGEGTGVIVREDGHIVTNNHVVEGAEEIVVRLMDEEELMSASVVARDPESDLAVIRLDVARTGLKAARFGDSEAVQPGDFVVALGSPFGLRQTITSGIISATGRENIGLATFEHFIQHDCAVNPGNSGGPLVNLHGEVIGINTAISSETGSFQGVSFAIPSVMAERISGELMEHGEVRRGWLGVSFQSLTPAAARALKAEGTSGAVVAAVVTDSPAMEAGLQVNDIITGIGEAKLRSATALINAIAGARPGTEVKLSVVRDGEELVVPVVLAQRSEGALERAARERRGGGQR